MVPVPRGLQWRRAARRIFGVTVNDAEISLAKAGDPGCAKVSYFGVSGAGTAVSSTGLV